MAISKIVPNSNKSTSTTFTSAVVAFTHYSLRKCNNLVLFSGQMDVSGTSGATWYNIGTIPTGYRPVEEAWGCGVDAWEHSFLLNVETNGNIRLYVDSDNTGGFCRFSMTWFTE